MQLDEGSLTFNANPEEVGRLLQTLVSIGNKIPGNWNTWPVGR